MVSGHEEIEEMTLVEHGRFQLLAESAMGWSTEALDIALALLKINDGDTPEETDGSECEGI